jgi:flagellar protein FlbB
MRRLMLPVAVAATALYFLAPELPWRVVSAEARTASAAPAVAPRPPGDDAASLELKRQQLAEREAALKAKEDALARLSATLDARVNELNAARKGLEGSLSAKKKQDDERYKKMIKIYKGLKPEADGALLNKLDGKMLIEMLNQMDQKTAIKLIPFITQPKVLEWTRLNLEGR